MAGRQPHPGQGAGLKRLPHRGQGVGLNRLPHRCQGAHTHERARLRAPLTPKAWPTAAAARPKSPPSPDAAAPDDARAASCAEPGAPPNMRAVCAVSCARSAARFAAASRSFFSFVAFFSAVVFLRRVRSCTSGPLPIMCVVSFVLMARQPEKEVGMGCQTRHPSHPIKNLFWV